MNTGAKHGTRRRDATTLALCIVALFVGSVQAETTKKSPRVGVLAFDEANCRKKPFIEGLSELGYVEGGNVVIE